MIETATFVCSICCEPSTDICVYCTKDCCRNHRCQRCLRCSDCCGCDIPLGAPELEPEAIPMDPVATAPVAQVPAEIPPAAVQSPTGEIPAATTPAAETEILGDLLAAKPERLPES